MGEMYCRPDADAARVAFAQKPRGLADKTTTVAEAVTRWVKDGMYLASGGFSTNRIPVAVLHEILRQNIQGLRFAGYTTTHAFQILAAGNSLGRGQTLTACDVAYAVGLEARGLSPHSRRVIQSGSVLTREWSNYTLALRFTAGAMGVPFLPARSLLGTDTQRHGDSIPITCPFTGIPLVAVPALNPDVAIIHVHEADRFGNGRFTGTSVADLEIARASKRVILTCERLVSDDVFRAEPHRTQIPFLCVDAVCEVPYGSYPGNMPGEYASDEVHLKAWLDAENEDAVFRAQLKEWIYDTQDFAGYLAACGATDRIPSLVSKERHRGA